MRRVLGNRMDSRKWGGEVQQVLSFPLLDTRAIPDPRLLGCQVMALGVPSAPCRCLDRGQKSKPGLGPLRSGLRSESCGSPQVSEGNLGTLSWGQTLSENGKLPTYLVPHKSQSTPIPPSALPYLIAQGFDYLNLPEIVLKPRKVSFPACITPREGCAQITDVHLKVHSDHRPHIILFFF